MTLVAVKACMGVQSSLSTRRSVWELPLVDTLPFRDNMFRVGSRALVDWLASKPQWWLQAYRISPSTTVTISESATQQPGLPRFSSEVPASGGNLTEMACTEGLEYHQQKVLVISQIR